MIVALAASSAVVKSDASCDLLRHALVFSYSSTVAMFARLQNPPHGVGFPESENVATSLRCCGVFRIIAHIARANSVAILQK